MAFDLNKNNGPAKSKFDLSKSDESTPDLQEPKKSNKTILIVVVLAVVVFGVYFFTKKDAKTEDASVATTDSTSVVASADTASATQPASSATTEATSVAPQVSAPATFEKASADVNNVDDAKLNQVLDYLKSNTSAKVTIEGYASSEGELNFNMNLSELRATNFAKYLISKGVNKDNLKTVGKGIENPIASNDDEAGRSQNRRIEIKF